MLIRRLARPLLASYFIIDGVDRFSDSKAAAQDAEEIAEWLSQRTSLPNDPELIVKALAGASVAGGVLLAAGRMPRPASVLLATTLVPGTYIHQDFWAESDPVRKAQKKSNFLRNASLLGGVVIAAVDTEGRPSLRLRATQGVTQTRREARHAARLAKRDAKLVAAKAGISDLGSGTGGASLTDTAKDAVEKARPYAEQAVATARPYAEQAAGLAGQAAENVRPYAEQAADTARREAANLAATAQPYAEDAAERARTEGASLAGTTRRKARKTAKNARKTSRKEGKALAKSARHQADNAAVTARDEGEAFVDNARQEAERLAKVTRRKARKAAKVARREAHALAKQAESALS